MSKVHARTPKNAMKWLFNLNILWHIKENAILRKCSSQRRELTFFYVHRLTKNLLDDIRIFFLCGFEIREDHALFRERSIELNLRAAGKQNNLSAMLVSDKRIEQIVWHRGKIITIFGKKLECINRHGMNICA